MPSWLDSAVFYEIYPQSFQDTDSDGIGDLRGIIRRLDYIRELGCNALWINPCFESPFNDAGYDISDYCRVAPRYGTNDDLCDLFREAHRLGLRVILDLVPGHTSSQHPWFAESKKAETNEFSHRYIWTDSVWKDFNGVTSVWGSLRAVSDRDGSCALNFFTSQPALNYGFARVTQPWQHSCDSPAALATREAMKEVMRFWLALGCDGFRVDMAGSLVKDDIDGEATIALWKEFLQFLGDEYPDAAVISEWGDPARSLRGGFHMDFLLHVGPSHYNDLFRCDEPFFSRRGRGDASAFIEYYENARASSGNRGLICIPSGNHDMDRLSRRLDAEEIKIAFAFLLSMPGAPFIYYGDEIGMRYLENLVSVEGGYNRTGSRSPMQWDATLNAGFSCAAPQRLYIRQDEDPGRPTVEKTIAEADSIYNEVKKIIAIRAAHEVLQSSGDITFLSGRVRGEALVYLRTGKSEKILVAINPAQREVVIGCPALSPAGVIYSHLQSAVMRDGRLVIPPASASWILLAQ